MNRNFHTEAEAKMKWCPEGRTVIGARGSPGSAAMNRLDDAASGQPVFATMCTASKCMHWRFGNDESSEERGYCGLSGRPD